MSADVIVQYKKNMQHEIKAGKHTWIVDEPPAIGGEDAGPTPYDLLLGGLGACTSMTMMMYARLKKWPLEDVRIELSHDKIYASDCADCETQSGKLDHIRRNITVYGPLSEEQVSRLKDIAQKCPVHQTLVGEVKVEDTIYHGSPPVQA